MIGQHYYTWCPTEVGIESFPGFQTRAQSRSVTPEIRKRILRYCERYEMPPSLAQLKAKATDLTPEELSQCPVGIHFYRLSEDLWGLTRVRLAARQKGRPGNHFAHTLVFPWDALRPLDFNPLALSRSGVFCEGVEDSIRELPELPEFPPPARSEAGAPSRFLHLEADLLGRLLACLTASPAEVRPVVLCGKHWADAAAWIEAALLLLPPSMRAEVYFSTYELDPYRILTRGQDGTTPRILVGTLPAGEGGKFQFRHDEFLSGFYVFDLAQQRFSDTPPVMGFERFAAEAFKQGGMGRVGRVHWLAEGVGAGTDATAWAALIPASGLAPLVSERGSAPTPPPHGGELRQAIQALRSICDDPARAARAVELLWQRMRDSLADDSAVAGVVLPACAEFLQQADDPAAFRRQVAGDLSSLLARFLVAGQYLLAKEALGLAGRSEGPVWQQVVREGWMEAERKGWANEASVHSPGPQDKEAFVELFSQALPALAGDSRSAPIFPRLTQAGLTRARQCSCLRRLWELSGKWLVEEGLHRLPRVEATATTKWLAQALAAEKMHEPLWEVLLWQFEYLAPPPEDRDALFGAMASELRTLVDPPGAARTLLDKAENVLGQKERIGLFVALLRSEEKAVEKEVRRRYVALTREKPGEEARWQLRKSVAAAGGHSLLAEECAEEIQARSWERSGPLLQAWTDELLAESPATAEAVVRRLVAMVSGQRDRKAAGDAMAVWLELLLQRGPRLMDAASAVAEALILLTPLSRLPGYSIGRDTVSTRQWQPAACACLEVLDCITHAPRLHAGKRPALPQLVRMYPDLPSAIRRLDDQHYTEACRWVVSGLCDTYLDDVETIQAAVQLLLDQEGCLRGDFTPVPNGVPDPRALTAADMIAEQLRQQLVRGAFRRDLLEHAWTLKHFVYTAAEVAAQSHSEWGEGAGVRSLVAEPSSLEQLLARVIGSVLAEDSSLVARLLWEHCGTHALMDSAWKQWLPRFRRQVGRESRHRQWQTSMLASLLRGLGKLWRLLG